MMSGKVVVGMSGGVDSSVAAYLLKEQGYEVIGVTMQIWQEEALHVQEENGGCCGLSAVEDARRVADHLGIRYYVMNFREEFQKHVIDYFVGEYRKGRTPNPCIACNHFVKWESLLQRSLEIGADSIATGHYARIEQLANGRYALKKSVTAAKDQTYALYGLTQEQLARTHMPVGDYEKDEVRRIAGEAGLPVASKPDSQEICFVPDGDYAAFIERETGRADEVGHLSMFMEMYSASIKALLIIRSASEKGWAWQWDIRFLSRRSGRKRGKSSSGNQRMCSARLCARAVLILCPCRSLTGECGLWRKSVTITGATTVRSVWWDGIQWRSCLTGRSGP